MNVINNPETYALITGASGGIGRELAEILARDGYNLVLISRRENVLETISYDLEKRYHVKILTLPCDLSQQETPKYIYEWCKEKNIAIDTIINDAGRGLFGDFSKLDIEKQMNMIELNISSLVKMNYYFIPELLKRPKAYILNVASIAALYPLPFYSVYGASKAFVLSFTEALRYELSNSNINVCCLCPGDTDTDFFMNAGNKNKKKSMISPSLVANAAVKSLLKNEAVIYPYNAKLMSKTPRFILKKMVLKRISKYRA